jgi:DNA-directed RNA polymerase specialized sigma24 family protein
MKNYYRFAENRNRFSDELDEGLPDITDILGDITKNEEYIALKKALADLPQMQYDVIYRRYYLEESFAKIGTVLDIAGIADDIRAMPMGMHTYCHSTQAVYD